jgi:hypothetical protein
VTHLIKAAGIDIAGNEFTAIAERYGTKEIRERILRELGGESLREDSFFVLPEFDSLPATARLSDVEAFQLSIRHALALLPALFSERTKSKADSDNPAWFRLD